MNVCQIRVKTMAFVVMASTIISATVHQDITVQTAMKVRLANIRPMWLVHSPYCIDSRNYTLCSLKTCTKIYRS